MKNLVLEINPVYGFVNYGYVDCTYNGGYITKMRCLNCGNAWIAENFISGHDTCPKCNSQGKEIIKTIE